MSARAELYAAVMDGGYHSPDRSEKASARIDAYRAEVLAEAADKLVLELAPEQQGASVGFLLALRLATRALRRMADDAATGVHPRGGAR
jgi:hypothetical protein